MPTNIQLNSKSGYYELVGVNWQTTFCLEQIGLLKMHKKYNYESILMYLMFFSFLKMSSMFLGTLDLQTYKRFMIVGLKT